jgi:hypothetical protein
MSDPEKADSIVIFGGRDASFRLFLRALPSLRAARPNAEYIPSIA